MPLGGWRSAAPPPPPFPPEPCPRLALTSERPANPWRPRAGPNNLMVTARRATNRDFKIKLPSAAGEGSEAGGEGRSKRQRRQEAAATAEQEEEEAQGEGEDTEGQQEEEVEEVGLRRLVGRAGACMSHALGVPVQWLVCKGVGSCSAGRPANAAMCLFGSDAMGMGSRPSHLSRISWLPQGYGEEGEEMDTREEEEY